MQYQLIGIASDGGNANLVTSQVERMQGITLVELLMTLIIVSIIMVSIYNVLQHSLQAYSHVEAQAEVTQNARMAMERFSREVRQSCIFRNPCNVNIIQFGIDNSDPGDGDDTDIGDTRIQYRLYRGNLRRRERVLPASFPSWNNAETVIADYVTGFSLAYRNEDNNVMSTPVSPQSERNRIRLISADIALEKGRDWGEDSYIVELRASAHPRNR